MMRLINLILFTLLVSVTGWAQQEIHSMDILIMPPSELNKNLFADKEFQKKILPNSLTAADSSQSVVAKIIDNSLSYWWNNSEIKNTSIGKTAAKIEENLKTEVDLGSSGSVEAKTDHKLSLKFLALQALAKLQYMGWIKAEINYDAKISKAELEVFENLSNNKDLVISHSVTALENKSQLSLRWNW